LREGSYTTDSEKHVMEGSGCGSFLSQGEPMALRSEGLSLVFVWSETALDVLFLLCMAGLAQSV
jgi:hypothetical protein